MIRFDLQRFAIKTVINGEVVEFLPVATTSEKGGVVIGDGVSVDSTGKISIPDATTVKSGLMSSSDKKKLNGIASGAQVNVIETVKVNGAALTPSSKSVNVDISGKVDKVSGKQLSTNDYTTNEKNKLSGIDSGAQVNVIETVKVNNTALEVTDKTVNIDISGKVDKISGKGLSTNDFTTTEKNKLSNIAAGAQVNVIETVKVNDTALTPSNKTVTIDISGKVDKVSGKGLSTNDYTTTEKNKLSGIASGAQVNVIESISIDGTNQTISSKKVALNLSDYAKKSDIASGIRIKGSVNSFSDLPTNAVTGDLYNIKTAGGTDGEGIAIRAGDNVVRTEDGKWDVMAGTVDLSNYVQKDGSKVLSTNDYTTDEKNKLSSIASGAQVNVIETIKVNGTTLIPSSKAVNIDISGKVDKVQGKQLSTNDFTNSYKSQLDSLNADNVQDNVIEFFAGDDIRFHERYAVAPFSGNGLLGLDLSNLIDDTNFELETVDENTVRIRSGSASFNVNNGISRGYVKVETFAAATVSVTYSISSQSNYDYGGCIVSENAPNTTFTYNNLKSANFFSKAGNYTNQTVTYQLEPNKTYYLNFGYAKNASTNSNDDRFYIHEIRVTPDFDISCKADYFFGLASDFYDIIVKDVGGKFVPAASNVQAFLSNDNQIQFFDNRLNKICAGKDYEVNINNPFQNGDYNVYPEYNSSTDKNWLESSSGATISLATDNSTLENIYNIEKLSETAGIMIYEQRTKAKASDEDWRPGKAAVYPFQVNSAGTPALGSSVSLMSAATIKGDSYSSRIIQSIFDPSHLMFIFKREGATQDVPYWYTTLAFNGTTNAAPSRTQDLNSLGTEWCTTHKSKTSTTITSSFLQPKVIIENGKVKVANPNYSIRYLPFLFVTQEVFDANEDLTSTTRYVLVHHGLGQQAPKKINLDTYTASTNTWTSTNPWIEDYESPGDDNNFIAGVWRTRDGTKCYAITFKANTYDYTPTWFDSAITIWTFDFLTPRIIKTNKKLSDIINELEL